MDFKLRVSYQVYYIITQKHYRRAQKKGGHARTVPVPPRFFERTPVLREKTQDARNIPRQIYTQGSVCDPTGDVPGFLRNHNMNMPMPLKGRVAEGHGLNLPYAYYRHFAETVAPGASRSSRYYLDRVVVDAYQ